jgi:hypothetical protein
MPVAWAGVAVLFAACPCGINAYLFAERYKQGVADASSAIALSTGLSLFTTIGWLTFLGVGDRDRSDSRETELPPDRLRRDAVRSQICEAPGQPALRQLLPGLVDKQPVEMVARRRQAEQALQQDMDLGRGFQILAAHDMADALQARRRRPPRDDSSSARPCAPARHRPSVPGRRRRHAPLRFRRRGDRAAIRRPISSGPGPWRGAGHAARPPRSVVAHPPSLRSRHVPG